MDEELMMEEESYPGVEFTPPANLFPSDQSEGEALIRWKKVGDRYTMIEIEGEPINPTPEEKKDKAMASKEKRQRMSVMDEIDMIAQIPPNE